ncbi:hypothetical protein QOZ95_005517 [Paenibacillus brasilensis]|uniref:Uncharacterized protein n=1 Tax=Paenibacillus brasilensis TaxID=128574 RepID=A0ABU0L7P1_9BACL|nr:hypothetical protein [Paenibacillus brasilensis]
MFREEALIIYTGRAGFASYNEYVILMYKIRVL